MRPKRKSSAADAPKRIHGREKLKSEYNVISIEDIDPRSAPRTREVILAKDDAPATRIPVDE